MSMRGHDECCLSSRIVATIGCAVVLALCADAVRRWPRLSVMAVVAAVTACQMAIWF